MPPDAATSRDCIPGVSHACGRHHGLGHQTNQPRLVAGTCLLAPRMPRSFHQAHAARCAGSRRHGVRFPRTSQDRGDGRYRSASPPRPPCLMNPPTDERTMRCLDSWETLPFAACTSRQMELLLWTSSRRGKIGNRALAPSDRSREGLAVAIAALTGGWKLWVAQPDDPNSPVLEFVGVAKKPDTEPAGLG